VSILDGKGQEMPAWTGKISEKQARGLVAYVRSLSPDAAGPGPEERQGINPSRFRVRDYRLRQEMRALQEQSRRLHAVSPRNAPRNPTASREIELDRAKAAASPKSQVVRELFQKRCASCHGRDGAGTQTRASVPAIPDFTKAAWQAQRSDAQLLASILEGKGDEMPAARAKISEDQARALVALVRSFAPGSAKPKHEPSQSRALSPPTDTEPDKGSPARREHGTSPAAHARTDAPGTQEPPTVAASARRASATNAARKLFAKRCAMCHGADGTGSQKRGELAAIPDFTVASWQSRRSDAQLLESILDGKGTEMPAWNGKISPEQAHALVGYVRSFATAIREREP
jgi:mono/diheme cytochrome c family protein